MMPLRIGKVIWQGILAALVLVTGQSLGALEIRDVLIQRLDRNDFPQLAGHSQSKGGSQRYGLFRSERASVPGLYYMVFFDQSLRRFPAGLSVLLEYYLPSDSRCHRLTFPFDDLPLGPQARRHRELWIGLTDGSAVGLRPSDCLAWRISLLTADGEVIARKASFLFCDRSQP